MIPANRINPVSAAVAKYFPAGNIAGDPFTQLNNLFFSGAQAQTSNDISYRMDHQLNDSTSIMGRFSDTFVTIAAPPIFPNISDPYNSTTTQRHMSSVLKLNKTFSLTLVSEFIFSWNRFFHYREQLSTKSLTRLSWDSPRISPPTARYWVSRRSTSKECRASADRSISRRVTIVRTFHPT